jgi:hypothetical protein
MLDGISEIFVNYCLFCLYFIQNLTGSNPNWDSIYQGFSRFSSVSPIECIWAMTVSFQVFTYLLSLILFPF